MPALHRFQERASVLAFRVGWRALRLLPSPFAYALFDAVAAVVTRRDGPSVQRLRSNYARVRPDLGPAELQEVTAEGVRRALRYYVEAFRLPSFSGEQVDDLVEITGTEPMRAELDQGRPVLAFLGHTGNWDLAGAWSARNLAHVVTVAERLRPQEMFQAFLDFREGELGMTIHPAERGTFGALLQQLRTGEPVIMPLLADRDLSASGIEVDLAGQRARVAAGPAALAVETGVPLFPVTMRHVRRGRQRWGLVVTVHPAVDVPADGTQAQRVAAATQSCADVLGSAIREHPQDWHMMQRVFVADLAARRRDADEAAA